MNNLIGTLTVEQTFNELLLSGYIDNDLFLTSKFDPSLNTLLTTYPLSSNNISNFLSKYYYTNYVTVAWKDFYDLDHAPYITKNNLQSQFNKINQVKIGETLFFKFDAKTFIRFS